jgi:hypothetical protein
MKVRLRAKPFFTGEFNGIQFIDGLSTEDVPSPIFSRIAAITDWEPEFVVVKSECESCKTMSNKIIELELELEKLKGKRKNNG